MFLEAASALEQAGRHKDAITVCEEVISRTTDLIPQTLQVEERLQQPECASPGAGLSQKKESLCCLAWRAAGYLHQGWAWATLGESKEAITQFSRCLGDLLRVQLYGSGVEPTGRTLHSWDLCRVWLGRDLRAWQHWVQEQGAEPSVTSGRRRLSQRAELCAIPELLKGQAGFGWTWVWPRLCLLSCCPGDS